MNKFNGIIVDKTKREKGLRGEVFDTLLSSLESNDLIELHEVVEDVMACIAKNDKEIVKQAQELNQRLSKENDKLRQELNIVKTENNVLKGNNKRQEARHMDEVNKLKQDISNLRGNSCMTNPEADIRPTVNVYKEDVDKMQRKIEALLDVIKKL